METETNKDIIPQLIDDSDSDESDTDFDLSEHEINEYNDQYGYTRIIRQINEDEFEVEWPDTYNITQSGIDHRLATPRLQSRWRALKSTSYKSPFRRLRVVPCLQIHCSTRSAMLNC